MEFEEILESLKAWILLLLLNLNQRKKIIVMPIVVSIFQSSLSKIYLSTFLFMLETMKKGTEKYKTKNWWINEKHEKG